MNGIEKIIEKIEIDNKIACDNIIKKAEVEALSIINKTELMCEKAEKDAIENAHKQCKIEVELAKSREENNRRKSILATKISVINEVITDGLAKLKGLADDEYFAIIKTLVGDFAKEGNGIIHFSQKDLNRLPQDFIASINENLKAKKATVVLGEKPFDIGSGFVLVYEDIEQNCTFDALLNASLDDIKDKLYEEIFMRDSI